MSKETDLDRVVRGQNASSCIKVDLVNFVKMVKIIGSQILSSPLSIRTLLFPSEELYRCMKAVFIRAKGRYQLELAKQLSSAKGRDEMDHAVLGCIVAVLEFSGKVLLQPSLLKNSGFQASVDRYTSFELGFLCQGCQEHLTSVGFDHYQQEFVFNFKWGFAL